MKDVTTLFKNGTVVDERYRIVDELDRGAMGVVFRAEHIRLRRMVALKVLAMKTATDRTRFEREAAILASLNHPHIVQCYDFGQTAAGDPYIVMELLKGVTVVTERDESRFRLHRATALVMQLLDGLSVAHRNGLVHRDLKPANLFITTDDRGRESLKILDFGLAKPIDDPDLSNLTRQGTVLGTPAYLAPEAVFEAVEQPCDVYACGLIMLEMMVGRCTFGSGLSALNTLYQSMTVPLEVPERLLATTYGRVLAHALARHPDDRPTSEEMLQALEKADDADFRLRPNEIPPLPAKGDLVLMGAVVKAGRDALRRLPPIAPYYAVEQFDPHATEPLDVSKLRATAGKAEANTAGENESDKGKTESPTDTIVEGPVVERRVIEPPANAPKSPEAPRVGFIGVPTPKPANIEVAYDVAEARRSESAAHAAQVVPAPSHRRRIRRRGGRRATVILAIVTLVGVSIWWFDIDVRKVPDRAAEVVDDIGARLNKVKKKEKSGKVKQKPLKMPDF